MINKKNLKIWIFTDDFYPIIWGQWMHIHSLYQEMIKSIPDNFLIFSPCKNNLINHIQIYPESRKSIFKNIWLSIRLYNNIEKIIKKYKLTHVHIHSWPWWLFMPKKLFVPLIFTCHHTYRQQMYYIRSEWRKYPFYLLEKKWYQYANKIICVSDDTKNRILNNYNISKNKLITIPNWINLNYRSNDWGIKKKKKSLLYIWRLDTRKWIDLLIKIMPDVIQTDPEITLTIAWKWPLLNRIQEFIKKHNLEKNIIFLWFVSEDNKKKLLLESEILVIPSIFEWFGIVALEGMACWCKIIANDTDGLRNIVKPNDRIDFNNKEITKIIIHNSLTKNTPYKLKQFDRKIISNSTYEVYYNT